MLRQILVLFTVLIGLTACEPGECPPGELGCPCAAAERCSDGLACSDGTCVAPAEVSLAVPASARACDVLLRDASGEVTGVRFEGGATGAHVREAPRTAVSFAASGGGPLGAVRVQVVGDGTGFSIERSRCFDGSGRELTERVRVGG